MTEEINVISRTQTVVVEPTSGCVSIINAGPMGPGGTPGAAGSGSSHYEDIFGSGYDPTGPSIFSRNLHVSQPNGSDWTVGPWIGADYPYWYSPEDCGGGEILVSWGVGDPTGAPPDPTCSSTPAYAYYAFQASQDNFGNASNFAEIFASDGTAYADLFIEQDLNGGSVTNNEFVMQASNNGTDWARIILNNTMSNTWILLNADEGQHNAVFTASGGIEAGTPTNTDVMLQVVPHPNLGAGVFMGYMRAIPAYVPPGMYVGWVDELAGNLNFMVGYKDGTTVKSGSIHLNGSSGGGGAVDSVNGLTGVVVLRAQDVYTDPVKVK